MENSEKIQGLTYNDEQIHKLDKVNLGTLVKRVLSIFQDNCVKNYQNMLSGHSNRIRTMSDIGKYLRQVNSSIAAWTLEMEACQCCLNNALSRLPQRIQQMNMVQTTVPSTPAHQTSINKELAKRMQQLRLEMKTVAHELQQNNSILERLHTITSEPDS